MILNDKGFKFSPTLRAEVEGELVITKNKKYKDKYNPLNIFGASNKATDLILKKRIEVENAFGSRKFADTYEKYVTLLDALFTLTMGYMLCDAQNEKEMRKAIKNYIGGNQYRRLPYMIKNTIVYRSRDEIKIDEVKLLLKKAAINKEMFGHIGELLMQRSKICSLVMQGYLNEIGLSC